MWKKLLLTCTLFIQAAGATECCYDPRSPPSRDQTDAVFAYETYPGIGYVDATKNVDLAFTGAVVVAFAVILSVALSTSPKTSH